MIYYMYIFDEVDFFVIWRMHHREKGPGTDVSQRGNMGHFLGGGDLDTLKELCAK